jgi:hypothetical protein
MGAPAAVFSHVRFVYAAIMLIACQLFAFLISSCFFLTACRLWATKSSLLPITRIYSPSEY